MTDDVRLTLTRRDVLAGGVALATVAALPSPPAPTRDVMFATAPSSEFRFCAVWNEKLGCAVFDLHELGISVSAGDTIVLEIGKDPVVLT